MKARVYKVELTVIEHSSDYGEGNLKTELEQIGYNYSVTVTDMKSKQIDWEDDSEFNRRDTVKEATEKLFSGE